MMGDRRVDQGALGLVGGEGFATDASLIKADANKQRSATAGEDVDWEGVAATRRSVREYLDTLDDAAWGAASEVEPKVLRSIPEGARDLARDLAQTDAYVAARRERKKVEMLFTHLKRILRLDRLRLRGPNGARDEFLLAASKTDRVALTTAGTTWRGGSLRPSFNLF